MIEKIEYMIYEFIRDKGTHPKKIFMTHNEKRELEIEAISLSGGFPNIKQPLQGETVFGLEINQTYPEVGMHLTT